MRGDAAEHILKPLCGLSQMFHENESKVHLVSHYFPLIVPHRPPPPPDSVRFMSEGTTKGAEPRTLSPLGLLTLDI